MIVAIDGPAGSGKSTVAKQVAQSLGFHYLDTGAMYRAVAYLALVAGVDLADGNAVAAIAESDPIVFAHESGDALPSRVLVGGHDVTSEIRLPQVDGAVSVVASIPRVREAMVAQQREAAGGGDVVVEGRDIGTVVFPDADVKVYLTASEDERVRRRAAQQEQGGVAIDLHQVHRSIVGRDVADSSRAHSPLQRADGAIELDTTGLNVPEVVARIVALAEAARS